MLFELWNVIIAQKLTKFIQIEQLVRNPFLYEKSVMRFFRIFEDLEFEVEKLFMLISSIFEIFWWFKVQNASTIIQLFNVLISSARGPARMHKNWLFQKICIKKCEIYDVNFFHGNFLARERFSARCRCQIWKVW